MRQVARRAGYSRLETAAAILAIFVFITGISSVPQLLGRVRKDPLSTVAGTDERHPRDEAARWHGYEPCSAIHRSSLTQGEHADREFFVCKGQRHLVLGSGAEGCGDLDIEVYDPDGRLVRADRTRGRHPAVFFRADRGGKYRVRVLNVSCPDVRCRYMVRMYRYRG
ncbi:MAG TPA: hypothetical protein VHG08_20205 [Longimicrobium sp.]|nr:hypothetical protein [Longimicrobium sp.]